MAYEYDIFLSYSRKPPVGDWVRNHFFPLLEMWLPQQLPYQPKIFIDAQMDDEAGISWPDELERALLCSKCLVAVWSPSYFRSDWCVAEWKSMEAREGLLGIRPGSNPSRLVVPVRFEDGDHFPDDAKTRQLKDLSKWNVPHLPYKETAGYIDLDREVKDLASDLAALVQTVPDWQDDWPVELPDSEPAPTTVQQPRWRR